MMCLSFNHCFTAYAIWIVLEIVFQAIYQTVDKCCTHVFGVTMVTAFMQVT